MTPQQKKQPRPKRFWYHYNKPASRKALKPILTVHWESRCILVEGVDITVPTKSRVRKSQPHIVITGSARNVVVDRKTKICSITN